MARSPTSTRGVTKILVWGSDGDATDATEDGVAKKPADLTAIDNTTLSSGAILGDGIDVGRALERGISDALDFGRSWEWHLRGIGGFAYLFGPAGSRREFARSTRPVCLELVVTVRHLTTKTKRTSESS